MQFGHEPEWTVTKGDERMYTDPQPRGIRTSECWLTLGTLLLIAGLVALGKDPQPLIDVAQFVVPAYAVSRGVVKVAK